MVQQIMTRLLGAASEEEKFQLSRRLYLVYWNGLVATIHRTLKVVAINANGISRQAYELQKKKL
jgi:hypothetical protein